MAIKFLNTVQVDTDVLYVDAYSNKVGIGTDSPTQKLDIRDGELVFTSSSTNQNPSGRIRFNEYGSSIVSGAYIDYDGSSNAFSMFTNDTLNDYEFLRANRNSHLLLQPNGNKVGIGTTSPSEKLVVRDGTSNTDVKILAYNSAAGTEATLKFSTIASETNYEKAAIIARNTAGSFGRSDMHFALDSTADSGNVQFSDTKMTILNGGNVGIGTTNPPSKLSVSGGTLSVSGSGAGFGVVKLGDPTDSNPYVGIYRSAAAAIATSGNFLNLGGYDGIAFTTGAAQLSGQSERMRILSNGNVGIGETDPDSKLHIKTPTVSSSDMLLLENYGWGANMTTGIAFKNGSNYQGQTAKIYTIMNGSGNQGGEIRFATLAYSGTNPNPNTTLYDRMTIDDLGNVGIGDTTPTYKLDVAGTGRFTGILTSNKLLQIPVAGTTVNEGMGIGLSLTDDFAYVGNDSTTRYLNHYGMGIHKPLQATISGGNGAYLSGYFGVDIFTAGNSRIHVNQTGNVGIGTTSPSEKLEVAGKVYIENQGVAWDPTTPGTTRGALHFDPVGNGANDTGNAITFGASDVSSGSTAQAGIYTRTDGNYGTRMYLATTDSYASGSKTRMTIYSNGNVGIGSIAPGEKLDVVGNIKVSGEQYFNGTVIYGDGKEIIKYSDSWLRINQAQNFTNGIYCGGGILRTDGIFQVGPSGTKLVVNSSGNVGIGTTSPANDLEIARTTSGAVAVLNLSGGTSGQYGGGGTINIKGGGQYMNFGLNVKNSSAGLESSIGYSGSTRTWTFDGNQLGENGGGYTSYNFKSEGSSQMVIYNNNVGIGETAPSSKLYIKGTTSTTSSQLMRIKSSTSLPSSPGRMIEFIRSNDAVRGYISMNQYGVQYNTTSDYRLKENITPINDAVSRLKELKPNRFSWKEGPSDYKVDGFIAHELAEVIPEAVSGEKDAFDKNNEPAYQGIDQAKVVPLLTAALQEAISKIEQLETRIQKLENK